MSPGGSITGLPPGIVNGSVHAVDAVASQAQADLTVAYDDAAGRTPPAVLPADMGGLFLTPGVYQRASALGLTGNVTLDAQGDPDAVFVVQAGTLTTASNSGVVLVGGAQACNVFWQIGSSATLGTDTAFMGTILARQSITLNTRASIQGRVLARGGAVTLDSNIVNRPGCTTAAIPGGAGAPPGGGAVPPVGGSATPDTDAANAVTVTGTTPAGSALPFDGGRAGTAGAALLTTNPASVGRTIAHTGASKCVQGTFRARVRGPHIRSVNFLVDGHSVAIQRIAPFAATIRLHHGIHKVRAHVRFKDGSPSRDVRFKFQACTQARRVVATAPSFTG